MISVNNQTDNYNETLLVSNNPGNKINLLTYFEIEEKGSELQEMNGKESEEEEKEKNGEISNSNDPEISVKTQKSEGTSPNKVFDKIKNTNNLYIIESESDCDKSDLNLNKKQQSYEQNSTQTKDRPNT